MANFHGVGIALKTKKPQVFEKNIKPFCCDYIPGPEFPNVCRKAIKVLLQEREDLVPLISKVTLWADRPLPTPREPFATVNHCDMWVNNTMQKIENGKVVKNKFVDFQVKLLYYFY